MGQPPSTLDADTLDPPSSSSSLVLPLRGLTLTLALHPDLGRCGDRAVLAGLGAGEVVVSRSEPSFLDPRGRTTGPLHDAHVSRAPLRLRPTGDDLVLDASALRGGVEVDGERIATTCVLGAPALERGVAIVLAGAVVLVLRRAAITRTARSDHGLLGTSDAVDAIRTGIDVAARHDDAVLLLGPSGTGKELVAHAIHRTSPRAKRPFVAVNVATLGASTAAAELFGHSKGAFTGAEGTHSGFFGRADGGTLFLDEIGDAPPLVQPMLLRALETGEVTPVGGRSTQRVDVRVVAATDHDVHRAAAEGEFRGPLLHRLASQTLVLAPLRERREDVLPLLVHFLREEKPDADASSIPVPLAIELLDRPWPGNVRELRNLARTLAREGPRALAPAVPAAPRASSAPTGERSDEELVAALRRNEFRIAATARELGIAKNTLYRWMERCALLRRARDLDASAIRAAHRDGDDLEATAARLEVSARALQLRARELGLDLFD